ncbi:MAG: hypothetical protein M1834_001251 [Cirrosporium novae-zelandiae]|nr:MAG: hypothetical protein M1834_001251 [Cirrosporium novae-zelandiae]
MAPIAVQFGGGNIGRGFVAEFLHLSGFEVVFVDVVDKVIDDLNSTKSYRVIEISSEGEDVKTITNYRALNSKTHENDVIEEISKAAVVTCAVGPRILKFIAPLIAKGIDKRTAQVPLAVIACENAINATDTLAGFIKDFYTKDISAQRVTSIHERARFANSAIDRIVPAQGSDQGLDVQIEAFYEWVVEAPPFEPFGHPKIDAVKWVDDLAPFIERKLFTVNTSHTAAAYYGHVRGFTVVHQVLELFELRELIRKAVEETAHLIVNKFGITAEDQNTYIDKIITRISNPYLADMIPRVGREPMRKLSRRERFVAPAAQLAEMGLQCEYLLGCIEMGFRFQNVEGDDESFELAKKLETQNPDEIAEEVCGLEKDHPLHDRVAEVINRVQISMESNGKITSNGNIKRYSMSKKNQENLNSNGRRYSREAIHLPPSRKSTMDGQDFASRYPPSRKSTLDQTDFASKF